MATNITLDAIVKGKKGSEKVGLKITEGSETYVLSSEGLTKFAEKTETRIPVTGPKAQGILDDVVQQLNKGEKLPSEVRQHFSKIVGHVETHHTDAVEGAIDALKGKVDQLENLKLAKTAEDAEKILTANPKLKHLLSDDLEKQLTNNLKVDMAKVDKLIAENAAKLARLEKAGQNLTTLMKADKIDHKAISRLLKENAHQLEDLEKQIGQETIDAASKNGLHLDGALSNIKDEFKAVSDEAHQLMGKWADEQRIITQSADEGKVKAAKEAAEKLEKDFNEILKGEYGAAVKASAPSELAEKIGRYNASLGKSLGAEAAAAKDGRGIMGKLFQKSEADIAKDSLTGIRKLHWGKMVGWAAALGVIGYIAGIGRNREQTKYTDQVASQQGQQVGAGIA